MCSKRCPSNVTFYTKYNKLGYLRCWKSRQSRILQNSKHPIVDVRARLSNKLVCIPKINWRFIEYLPGLRSWLTSISWEVVRPGSLSTAIFSRKRLALDLDILIYFPLNKEQKAKLWREGGTKGDKKEKDGSASPFQMKKSSYLLIDASRPRLEGKALSLSGSCALPLIIYSKE